MANTKVTGDLIASGTITAANLVTGTLDGLLNTYLTTNTYATESYVTTAVNNLIDSAPASLDTLNELAAALNDDANFATTVTNALATKLNLSGGNITGNLSVDTNVLFVDTVNDRVGIGATTPSSKLEIVTQNTNSDGISITADGSSFGYASNIYLKSKLEVGGSIVTQGKITSQAESVNNSFVSFSTVGSGTLTEAMRITSAGNVGIGTSSPDSAFALNVNSDTDYKGILVSGAGHQYIKIQSSTSARQAIIGYNNGSKGYSVGLGTDNSFQFYDNTAATERMRITSDGNVGIGTSSPAAGFKLDVAGGVKIAYDDPDVAAINLVANVGTNAVAVKFQNTGGNFYIGKDNSAGTRVSGTAYSNAVWAENSNPLDFGVGNVLRARLTTSGLTVYGSLSKSSGSFKIDHPIKEDTHYLVHSFVESPQANNIYRGKVQLVDGKSAINLDEVSTMTEGTFVALNRDIHTYTSNESDWDAVRGSVIGNILTIECQNAESTATVSWLVIGERQDKHMYDTGWTDENGKVIVEPEKEIHNLKAQLNG